MKATITRVIEANGDRFFVLKCEAGTHHYQFKENQSEDSIWNEKVNYERALKMAKLIESGATRIEETVYETGNDDIPAPLFQSPQNS